MNSILTTSNSSDSELTACALAGQHDAFAQIVSRYQSLVCSLAYSATGNLSQSEDLAQETFIAAWKGLQTLREPEKLRSWLCGIARNIIAGAVQHKKRELADAAESIDAALDQPSSASLPVDRAISREEESILWRSLKHIPEIYREPLILFYREGQSVESVAQELELSEEAVKQRLSRGRKLLKMEVAAFVESALKQSAPGRDFTSVVLAALPALSISAGASPIGVALSKGSAIAKTSSFAGFIGGMLTPILGMLGGFLSLVGFVKSARSTRDRSLSIKSIVILIGIFVIGQSAAHWVQDGRLFVPIFLTTFIAQAFVCIIWGVSVNRLRKKIQIEQCRTQERADAKLPFDSPESKGFKWNVYGGLLGLIFANPFALLAVMAAKVHDTVALSTILIITIAAFILGSRAIIRRPERSWDVIRTVPIASFPLLLLTIYLRWEKWTGQPAWQVPGDALFYIAIGFLLFAYFAIHWLVKGNQ